MNSRRQKVMEAIQDIRQFYRDGRGIPPKKWHWDVYRKRIIDEEAARLNMNPDTARKARQFVDRETGYTRKDLAELCNLIKSTQLCQDEKKAVFGRTHVIRLLAVERKEDRRALQRQAIEEAWSLRELEIEITQRFGTRRHGGRRRRIPRGLAEFLTSTEVQCESWRRWRAELSREAKDEDDRHVMLGDLPRPIQTLIVEVSDQVERLRNATVKELSVIQPGREVRKVFEDELQAASSTKSQHKKRRSSRKR